MAFILKNFLQVLKVGLLLNEQVHKPSAAAFLGVWGWEAPGFIHFLFLSPRRHHSPDGPSHFSQFSHKT